MNTAEDMIIDEQSNVTVLLKSWNQGNQSALNKLVSMLYKDLHAMARQYMRAENSGHTLQPTALINELYMRLADNPAELLFNDRQHFFRTACRMMRRLLMDHARIRGAKKRAGGNAETLDEVSFFQGVRDMRPEMLLTLDNALKKLEADHPRLGQLLQLRMLLGFSNKEAAEVMDVSLATIKRDWNLAKARLYLEMNR